MYSRCSLAIFVSDTVSSMIAAGIDRILMRVFILSLLVGTIVCNVRLVASAQETTSGNLRPSFSSTRIAAFNATPGPTVPPASGATNWSSQLSPPARELAERLKIIPLVENLQKKQDEYSRTKDTAALLEVVVLRQKLHDAMQYASIEVEEAVAAIDGDLALSNMLLAYVSARRDRQATLNNVATFVGSGALGVLDSGASIKLGPPTPQIFGIIGNSIAVGVPTIGLRRRAFSNPRQGSQTNMLAPIFGKPFTGESYDPLIWSYLESVPAESNQKQTMRQLLVQRWRAYRGLRAGDESYIDALVGVPGKDAKVTVELLKERSELLFDLRSLIQQIYRDISEVNSALLSV